MDSIESISSIIACFLVAGKTVCPQRCFLTTAVVLSLVYTAVTWQWVYMSQYFFSASDYVKALDCPIQGKAYWWIGPPQLHRGVEFLLPELSMVWQLFGFMLLTSSTILLRRHVPGTLKTSAAWLMLLNYRKGFRTLFVYSAAVE
jgi:hypothetical protein